MRATFCIFVGMKVEELFERCVEIVKAEPSMALLRYMHETLVLACAEALRGSGQGFGNLMAQTDYLCKRAGIGIADRIAIQTMRRHSNGSDSVITSQELRYDVRALALFISSVFNEDIPHELVIRIPTSPPPTSLSPRVNQRYVRCVVTTWDDEYVYATTDDGEVCIKTDDASLRTLLTEGMQLNLLDSHREGQTLQPQLIVVEPDFLLDISSLAACFSDYGHHPIAYTFGRLKPAANTQAILLGNFAGAALDDIINQSRFQVNDTIRHSFYEQALQFCTCKDFNPQQFKADALVQVANIQEAVTQFFTFHSIPEQSSPTRSLSLFTLLEPSFVCEHLGLQGRVDLMTQDMHLLVEQKSGKNWQLEHKAPIPYSESHYVQLLLYYGIFRYNFHLPADKVDIRLLYSRYPAKQGLLIVNYYQQLFHEAIRLRNQIVAQEIQIAHKGFAHIEPQLSADTLNERNVQNKLFEHFVRPQTEQLLAPLKALSETERHYVERMLTFVYREQLAQKIGVQEGQGGAVANLWNMPLAEKRDTGSIFYGLRILHKEQSSDYSGYDRLILSIPDMGDDFLPNFRRNDMVCLYAYKDQPDICASILYKGVIERLTDHEVTVRLNDGQQNADVFADTTYAIEPSFSDRSMNKNVTNISGVPSWMLSVLNCMMEITGKTHLEEVWPNLEVFFHGGVAFTPYRKQYEQLITSPNMHYMETYNASEGFFGLQDDPADKSMLLMLDYGVFYEFEDLSCETGEHIVPLWGVEKDKNYAMLISTSCGLWRYKIGDTVRFTSTNPYKFVITGRTKSFINAFGEELIVDNAEQGLSYACQQTGAEVLEYTAAPVFMDANAKCRHQWLIEFSKPPQDLKVFAQLLDQKLQEVNSDYEAKRFKNITLQPLELIEARQGLFNDWLKMRGKLGGQHKVPRLSNSREHIEQLLALNEK